MTKRKHKERKNYNPFKMWGSYIGAIIGFFVPIPFTSVIGFIIGWIINSIYRKYK